MTQELRNLIRTRADEVQRHYHKRGRLFRALWLAAAFVVLAAGLAMTVLPGPAIIVIPIGIAMLAARFRWAQMLLHAIIEHGVAFHRRLVKSPMPVRLAVWAMAATVAGSLVYVLLLR